MMDFQQIIKQDAKQPLLTIHEIPHEEAKQKDGLDASYQDSQPIQGFFTNENQYNIGSSVFQKQLLSNEDDTISEDSRDLEEGIYKILNSEGSSQYPDNQMKFISIDQQNIANSIDDLNIMKRGFRRIFKHLTGLEQSINILPEKMGQTFDHMKAVLDKRYQAMLKAFINAQSKIKEYNIKLRNMEFKLNINQYLKNLQMECEIYKEFSALLTKDMEMLTVEIKKEEKRLNQMHTLYEIRKEKLSILNEQNLYFSGVITKIQKKIKRFYKKKSMENQPPRYTSYYAKNDNGIQMIEKLCGASKVRMFRSTNSKFGSNMASKASKYNSQINKTLKQNDLQIETNQELYQSSNEFQSNKFSSIQHGQFSTVSQVKFKLDSDNLKIDQQMRQTTFSKPSTNDNDVMGSTQLTFKRQITPQVRIINQTQTNDKFFGHQGHPQLQQTFFSKTDQLFMKKPMNDFQSPSATTMNQINLRDQINGNKNKLNYISLNEKSLSNNKIEIEFKLPQNITSLNEVKIRRQDDTHQTQQQFNQNNLNHQEINSEDKNLYTKQEDQLKQKQEEIDQQSKQANKIQYYDQLLEIQYNEDDIEEGQDFQVQEELTEEDYQKMIYEVDQSIHKMKQSNEKLKIKMINKSNQFYNRFELLKSCLAAYKTYLEQNQRIAGSKEGLHGSLLFEMAKLKQVQSQPVIHAFSKQSYKPSYIMDRESRMIIYETLKCMLDKQIQDKQKKIAESKKIDKKVFLNFSPIQLIGMMCFKPSSFEEMQFIMERKARMIQEKVNSNKILSSSLYQILQNQ